jgi:dihydroorotate dehydrogenase
MIAVDLARLEIKYRSFLTSLHPVIATAIYSKGRKIFLQKLKQEIPQEVFTLPGNLSRTLWGIEFRSPIMNAAGMFKNAECYELYAMQGAGAYLGGTGTWNGRYGNRKRLIHLPFVAYPKSHSGSNFLGLPNDGDEKNSKRASEMTRLEGTPVGWSAMGSPDLTGDEKLQKLVTSLQLYAKAGVDFLEINESCPNTAHGKPQGDDLAKRLRFIKDNFLDRRTGTLPVIVKFSNDTEVEQLPKLLDLLFEFGFDGVNFGNTSTDYSSIGNYIESSERKIFEYFSRTFGGGVSGRPLKEISLELCSAAVKYLKAGAPEQEFHVIRTGGIESWQDILASDAVGVSLNQWFSGYFENFAQHGHNVYKNLYEQAN